MSQLLIQSLGCPNCGAPYDPALRECKYCGSVLIVTSVDEIAERDLKKVDISGSVEKWRKAVAAQPENAEAHYALGLAYLNSRFRDAALEQFRKATLLMPEAADAHYNLAVTLFNDGNLALNSPEYAEMAREIDYSVRLAPDFKEAVAFQHFFIARKLDSTDNHQASVEYIKAIDVCSNIAVMWSNLGLCYYRVTDYKNAIRCFEQATTLNPKLGIAYSNMANVMFKQGAYPQGLELATKALSLMGPATLPIQQADANSAMALCLWKLHRKPEALEHIKRAVALAPNFPVYRQNLNAIQRNGCFIATATLGDASHPWIMELSAFRDGALAHSRPGRGLIEAYYCVSPFFAAIIAQSPVLRLLSRYLVVVPALMVARFWSRLR